MVSETINVMMRLPKFTYRVPKTISDAVKIAGDVGGDGMFVAVGTEQQKSASITG